MGLFNRGKEKAVSRFDELQTARIKARAAYALAEIIDEEVIKPEDPAQGLKQAIADDFAYFMACLTAVDGECSLYELETINAVLGLELDEEACKALTAGEDQVRFTRTVPTSFALMEQYHADPLIDEVAACAIDVYDGLGMAVAAADGTVEKEEAWEINGFVALLRRYIKWEK